MEIIELYWSDLTDHLFWCNKKTNHPDKLLHYIWDHYIDGVSGNKVSLVGMQLPEKYEENFDVSREGPSSGERHLVWSMPGIFLLVPLTQYFINVSSVRRNYTKLVRRGQLYVQRSVKCTL